MIKNICLVVSTAAFTAAMTAIACKTIQVLDKMEKETGSVPSLSEYLRKVHTIAIQN